MEPVTRIGPIVLTAVGNSYVLPCRVALIIWEGATTAGDRVVLSDPVTGEILWFGRTDVTNTYIGASFPVPGVHCPHGFKVTTLAAGQLAVYLQESRR